jgi:hypothetical protein
LQQLGIEAIDDSTPASMRAFVEAENVKWRDIVQLASVKVD